MLLLIALDMPIMLSVIVLVIVACSVFAGLVLLSLGNTNDPFTRPWHEW